MAIITSRGSRSKEYTPMQIIGNTSLDSTGDNHAAIVDSEGELLIASRFGYGLVFGTNVADVLTTESVLAGGYSDAVYISVLNRSVSVGIYSDTATTITVLVSPIGGILANYVESISFLVGAGERVIYELSPVGAYYALQSSGAANIWAWFGEF